VSQRIPVYYPLRANAYGLVKGAPLEAFRQRLKVAALLNDRLALDDGSWMASAGPRGATEFRTPGDDGPNHDLQTGRERQKAQGGEFYVAMGRSGSSAPLRRVIQSPATISWRATFRPIKDELPRAYPWIEFGSADLYPADKRLADEMADAEERSGLLSARFPDRFVRSIVLKGAAHSMVLAARMGAALSTDSLHGEVLAASVARGDGRLVLGQGALLAVVPDVRRLSWSDVDAARGLPGLPRLRDVLAEVEEGAAAGSTFDEAALREYHRQYARARDEAAGGWGNVGTSIVVGAAVSVMTFPIAGPGSLAAGVALGATTEVGRHLLGQRTRRNSWMAAADALTKMAQHAK
jgi:hypothetical protein